MEMKEIIILAIGFAVFLLTAYALHGKKKHKWENNEPTNHTQHRPTQHRHTSPSKPVQPVPAPTRVVQPTAARTRVVQPSTAPTRVVQHTAAQQQTAAKKAAADMGTQQLHANHSEALNIQRVIHQQNLNINSGFLSQAQSKIVKICAHAESIRSEIQKNYSNPSHLIQLYRTGVAVSNEAYQLRSEVRAMKDSIYRLARSNPSLRPLAEQVNAFYNSIYADETVLNNRNTILRKYIGANFGANERRWNEDIEARIRAKRSA